MIIRENEGKDSAEIFSEERDRLEAYIRPRNELEEQAAWITNKYLELLFRAGYRSYKEMGEAFDRHIGIEGWVIYGNNSHKFVADLFDEIVKVLNGGFGEAEKSLFLLHLHEMIVSGKSFESLLIENGFSSPYFIQRFGLEHISDMKARFQGMRIAERFFIIANMAMADMLSAKYRLPYAHHAATA